MENVSNISSEEELLQLHNEGKISEAEYQDLLATIRKSPVEDANSAVNAGKLAIHTATANGVDMVGGEMYFHTGIAERVEMDLLFICAYLRNTCSVLYATGTTGCTVKSCYDCFCILLISLLLSQPC